MNKNLYWAFGLVAGSWSICLFVSIVISLVNQINSDRQAVVSPPTILKFQTESEFRNYLSEARNQIDLVPAELGMPLTKDLETTSRYSETNVQVKGIDEPDIVKTDGKQVYVSSQSHYFINQLMPEKMDGITNVIQALPVDETKKIASVDVGGNLLIANDRLVVFESKKITGFDISEPKQPRQVWEYEFDGNRQIESARLVNDKIVVVSELPVYLGSPCPLPLGKTNEEMTIVPCTDIFRPEGKVEANTTYTIMRMDPKNGQVEATTTVIGSRNQTVVYVSNSAVYVTFSQSLSREEIMLKLLLEPESTLVSEEIKNRLARVETLDISRAAKQVEVTQIIAGYTNSFSDDERMKWQAEMNNQMDSFQDNFKRTIEETIIAKIDLNQWAISSSGKVPGRPLNQFSLDEYDDHLRIATTIGSKANDVYILDSNLNQVGSVLDLGKNERIYAVRFEGKRGFVITFKETDPLYTIDLSQPLEPKVTGQLKIPGYSSYLHPLTQDLLVGIGKEDSQVKVSLFNVSDMAQPEEIDKYQLPDYWSDVLSTHHAFMQDDKHQIMFIPANTGGYIFSYTDNKLKLEKAVSGKVISRALYINDYLYLVGQNRIDVLSENNWQTVTEVEW